MFTVRRFRLIALAALSAFAFAQAAVAAMGCATMRVDAAHGDVALMPDGSPCDMMGGVPAPITLKHCGQAADTVAADLAPLMFSLNAPALPATALVVIADATPAASHAHHAARILGPPPFQATQRLRI